MYFLTKAKSSTLIKRFLDESYCCTWLSTSAPPTWPGTRYLRRYIYLQLFLKFTYLYLYIHQYKALIALVDNTRIHISLSICIFTYIFTTLNIYLHISLSTELSYIFTYLYQHSYHIFSHMSMINQRSNKDVVALVDNTRIHLLPSMNPDGWKIATDAVSLS